MSIPGTTPVPSLLPDYMRSLAILSQQVNINGQSTLNNIKIQQISNEQTDNNGGNIGIGINSNKNTVVPTAHNIGL